MSRRLVEDTIIKNYTDENQAREMLMKCVKPEMVWHLVKGSVNQLSSFSLDIEKALIFYNIGKAKEALMLNGKAISPNKKNQHTRSNISGLTGEATGTTRTKSGKHSDNDRDNAANSQEISEINKLIKTRSQNVVP